MSITSLAIAMHLTCVVAELQRRALAAEPQERPVWAAAIDAVRVQLRTLGDDS